MLIYASSFVFDMFGFQYQLGVQNLKMHIMQNADRRPGSIRLLLSVGIIAGITVLIGIACQLPSPAKAQAAAPKLESPQLVWLDTDIGDDIDDAFALGLILRSPDLRLLGISTAFGDTETRARIVDRFLAATHAQGIPVAAGVRTITDNV